MHVHCKARAERAVPRHRPALLALALATTALLAACSGDGPSVAPRPVRDGQLVHVSGSTEFSVRPTRGAPARVIHRGSFTTNATMTLGVARADLPLRSLDRRFESSDQAPPGASAPDSVAVLRLLDRAAATLLPALAIDEGSKLAAFGTGSVIESVIRDEHGAEARIIAISDLQRGPLTDYLVVQDGRPVRYNRVEWVRANGIWTATSATAIALLEHGGAFIARTRADGVRFAAADTGAPSSFAAIAARIEEIRFGALAKRLVLPSAAHAQDADGWTAPADFSCDKFRNVLVSPETPCQAYALNAGLTPLIWLAELIPTITAAHAMQLLITGNVVAILDALGTAAGAVAAFAPEILQAVALAMAMSYVVNYVDCRTNKVEPARYCAKTDPRAPSGGSGGGSDDAYADTGLVGEACGLFCDPSRRGTIDSWRSGLRAAE